MPRSESTASSLRVLLTLGGQRGSSRAGRRARTGRSGMISGSTPPASSLPINTSATGERGRYPVHPAGAVPSEPRYGRQADTRGRDETGQDPLDVLVRESRVQQP